MKSLHCLCGQTTFQMNLNNCFVIVLSNLNTQIMEFMDNGNGTTVGFTTRCLYNMKILPGIKRFLPRALIFLDKLLAKDRHGPFSHSDPSKFSVKKIILKVVNPVTALSLWKYQ